MHLRRVSQHESRTPKASDGIVHFALTEPGRGGERGVGQSGRQGQLECDGDVLGLERRRGSEEREGAKRSCFLNPELVPPEVNEGARPTARGHAVRAFSYPFRATSQNG